MNNNKPEPLATVIMSGLACLALVALWLFVALGALSH